MQSKRQRERGVEEDGAMLTFGVKKFVILYGKAFRCTSGLPCVLTV